MIRSLNAQKRKNDLKLAIIGFWVSLELACVAGSHDA